MMRGIVVMMGLAIAGLPMPAPAAEIACASQPLGYTYCRTDTSGGVRLVQQISGYPCNQDNTWGHDKAGIWVSNGCAARFRVGSMAPPAQDARKEAQAAGAENLARDLANQGPQPRQRNLAPPPAAPSGGRALMGGMAQPAIVVCESKQYALKQCPVRVRTNVEMRRKLGQAECRHNVTWGYDFSQIWVTNGCRAEFAVY
jgi:hypothetical protein